MRHGVRIPEDETWCPGWYILKGTSLKKGDWKKGGHGHTNLRKAIAESCDVYFYALANEMGIDLIYDSMSEFGFGKRTMVDIGGESAGLMPSREWKRKTLNEAWYPGETLNIGIGQGAILATPIQLAVATAAIANRGNVLKPRFFAEARDPLSGETVATGEREVLHRIINTEEDWEHIISGMYDVIHASNGTARRVGMGAAYEFAGKSGTAQVFSLAEDEEYDADKLVKELHDHALFVAFAPINDPKIVVSIIVENGGGGSSNAAPIARLLFDDYFEQTGIPQEVSLNDETTIIF